MINTVDLFDNNIRECDEDALFQLLYLVEKHLPRYNFEILSMDGKRILSNPKSITR
ncbi:MAG: hypothetical protein GY710_25860 [Desulfobacteraceae bacterium]|nr:hypothetical protein [Desulfobacteraceae bacterium]